MSDYHSINLWGHSYYPDDTEDKEEEKTNNEPKCECGALKTYGPKAIRLHHAFYCPMRGNVDDEIND